MDSYLGRDNAWLDDIELENAEQVSALQSQGDAFSRRGRMMLLQDSDAAPVQRRTAKH